MLIPGGAAAISVMLLPGISGTLLLVLINHYQPVTTALHDRDWGTLAVFLAGIATGVLLFIPLLRRLLLKAHDLTMALLTGLMLGSLRALWPWKDNYDFKSGPMVNLGTDGVGSHPSEIVLVVVAGVLGAAAAIGMVWLEGRLRRRGAEG
jgi:putative membrane protein